MNARHDLPTCDVVSASAAPESSTVCCGVGGQFEGRDFTWLSVRRAAELLAITRQHLYRVADQYTIRSRKRGKRDVLEIALETLPNHAQAQYFAAQLPQATMTIIENDQKILDMDARAATPAWARDKADTKLRAVQQFRKWESQSGLGGVVEALKKFCEEKPYHWQSLNRWVKAHAAHGYLGLVDGYGNRAGDSILSASDRKELYAVFILAQGSKGQAFNRLAKVCRREGREVPSATVVNRLLAHWSVLRARTYHAGENSFNADYEPHGRLNYDELRPLDWVSADHHRMDAFVRVVRKRDPQGRPIKWALVRPWLTAFHDDKSKRFLGWYIVAGQAPNHLTIHQAFIMMVTECGVPRRVKFDNGKDFLHHHFIGGTDHQKFRRKRKGVKGRDESELPGVFITLDTKFTAVRAYHGASKRIERTFKEVVNDWASKWPTYCGPNSASVPERSERARKQAERELAATGKTTLVPDLDEFIYEFAEWVDLTYHQTAQDGHGMNHRTPTQVWNDEIHDKPVTRLTTQQVHYLLMKRQKAVARDGIEFKGANYWADEIGGDVHREVVVAWDPADLSKLYVSNLNGTPLCIAKLDRHNSQFANEDQHRKINHRRKLVKKKGRELEGMRRSLAQQEILLRNLRKSARVEDPDEPESPRQIKPMFGAAADAAAFFEDYEVQKAVNAPELPPSAAPADLLDDAFRTTKKSHPKPAPVTPLALDDFYKSPTSKED